MTLPRPQRILLISPPGSLLKRIGAAAAQPAPRKDDADRDRDYLALVRQCPCLKCGMDPAGIAAHLRANSGAHNKRQGMQRKPADRWATPLCAGCHTEDKDAQHKMGELAFWDALGLNPFLVCEQLYAQRGDLVAMRAVVFVTISQRRIV